ncbi:MAG: SMP-30/gluconolactonase/LRE family protein [Bacteroidota bacterium]
MKRTFAFMACVVALSSCHAQDNIIADGAELALVAEDFKFTEGPALAPNGDVYFTDQPNDRILKWDARTNVVDTYLQPAGRSNGLYFDHDGNLLSCADEKNELWRIGPGKKVTVLVQDFKDRKLNGPNDLWVNPQGGIYFTDPFYKRPWWDHNVPQQEGKRVYYLNSETGQVHIVAQDFVQPNGIIGTPNGKTLYVADIGDKKTYAYKIGKDGALKKRTLFVAMGSDGMTLDHKGNVYLTGDGVTVCNKKGKKILHIPVPEKWTANVTFGGPDQDILFITAMDAIYTLKMAVHGVR